MPPIHRQSHIHAGAIGRPVGELLERAIAGHTRRQLTASMSDDHKVRMTGERYLGPDNKMMAELTTFQPVTPMGRPDGASQVTLKLPQPDGFQLSYIAEGGPTIVQVECQGDPRTGEGSFTLRGKGETQGDVHIATFPHEQRILYSRLTAGELDTVYDYANSGAKLYTP